MGIIFHAKDLLSCLKHIFRTNYHQMTHEERRDLYLY
jgi:hypothetical protein